MDRRAFLRTTALGTVAVAGSSSCSGSTPAPERADPSVRAGWSALGSSNAPAGSSVRTGFEMLADSGYALVRGHRVGLVSNPTGVVRDLRHEVDVMADSGQVDLVAAFGPEHGFRGDARYGGGGSVYRDPRTGIRVYDTYDMGPIEIAGLFRDTGIDTVMFDIQDVGARFFTYIWTMYDCMVAASRARVRFVVLDRPNPISGRQAYGPVMHPQYATFVGRRKIALQHAMTVGELARMFNAEFIGDEAHAAGRVDLEVSQMAGWRRDLFYDQTGLPWVMPSPSMPQLETAMVYPGTCLFEGTNLSEGRGTTRPFELIGAPYVNHRWARELSREDLRGVDFRETYFEPVSSEYGGRTCGGVQLHVTDRREFDAVRTAVAMMVTARRLYGGDFAWSESSSPYWIDLLTGSNAVRKAIDAGASTGDVVHGWQDDLEAFRRRREPYLLYGSTS
ncbi:MAG: exo-beta-N-acetylmuramidase NamZ family protein [Nocardioidaceae bacterium]